MNEEQIRKIVQQEILNSDSKNRFSLAPIPQFAGTGIGVPLNSQQILTYIGFIPYDGNPVGGLECILPTGWNITYDSGTTLGSYTLNHNLGTLLYSCVASGTDSTGTICVPVIAPFSNQVVISWFQSSDVFTRAETSFYFILTQINNPTTSLPTYTTNPVNLIV